MNNKNVQCFLRTPAFQFYYTFIEYSVKEYDTLSNCVLITCWEAKWRQQICAISTSGIKLIQGLVFFLYWAYFQCTALRSLVPNGSVILLAHCVAFDRSAFSFENIYGLQLVLLLASNNTISFIHSTEIYWVPTHCQTLHLALEMSKTYYLHCQWFFSQPDQTQLTRS